MTIQTKTINGKHKCVFKYCKRLYLLILILFIFYRIKSSKRNVYANIIHYNNVKKYQKRKSMWLFVQNRYKNAQQPLRWVRWKLLKNLCYEYALPFLIKKQFLTTTEVAHHTEKTFYNSLNSITVPVYTDSYRTTGHIM